jgi:hypothetical protein
LSPVKKHDDFVSTADSIFQRALCKLIAEIFDGPPGDEAYVLNPGDKGLLAQLDTISAEGASARPMPGKTTIASHVDHLHYGLSLLNRWASGEKNPWADADWTASWKRTTVTEEQWRTLRLNLRQESRTWVRLVHNRRTFDDVTAAGAISSAAHTAYHLGAIRQIIASLSPE